VLNTIVLINQITIANLAGAARLIQKQIPCILKLKKASHAHMYSNAPTVRVNIKWTQTYVCFGGIDLTESGIKRNTSRSMKTGPNQFV